MVVDTARLEDGTYELNAVATDAADQAGTATTVLKVDRHAPAMPENLAVERNPDGTMTFVWTNPAQGDGRARRLRALRGVRRRGGGLQS